MIRLFLLITLFFVVTLVSAQETWTFDTKNAKVGEPIEGKLTTEKPIPKYTLTSGECLSDAGTFYLFGTGLALAGSAFALSNINDENADNSRLIAGGVMAVGGLVATIIGHTKLVKAGKILDEERKITLQPSSSGIGLALKF